MNAPEEPHALVRGAAEGRLPPWSAAGGERRAHMQRVADLLDGWAADLGLSDADRARWRAAGWLHDALRDEDPEALRSVVPEGSRALPPQLLHGPAVAARLWSEGVRDEELGQAVAWHTIGSAELGPLGRALYAADFLEPGRSFLGEWRGELRERMPADMDAVLIEVVRARLEHLLRRTSDVLPETVGFWNSLVRDGG